MKIALVSLKTMSDLGVGLDSELTFTSHIMAICASAASALEYVIYLLYAFVMNSLR